MPSPVSTLLAGLQAAQHARTDFFINRSGRKSGSRGGGYDTSSPSRSPEGDRLIKSRLSPATKTGEPADTALASEGFLLDMHQLVRDASVTLDVFKGSLVVLMATSNVIITMSSAQMRSHSWGSLLICNAASSFCFVGFLLAFGFSCYNQYLQSDWPDPPKDVASLRLRVSRAIAFPVLGAWVCNFVWCFLCLKNDLSRANLLDCFTFARVFGNGPDFLCNFSFDLALVYTLWRPIMRLLDNVRTAETAGWIVRLIPVAEHRRDAAALAIVLSPLLFTLAAVPDCTSHMRLVQWFLVCDKRDLDTPSLPALPHVMDFGLGILAAVCWHRFLADLRPVGDGGPSGGYSILPMQALRRWFLRMLGTSMLLLVLFVPLGQVWFYTDLSVVQMATPFGQLIRGFSDGPSMLWLLATLWPITIWAGIVVVLVTLRGTVLGYGLHWPLAWLEHLGANVLFYFIVLDLFLAGMFKGFSRANPFPFTLPMCLMCTAIILLFGRFLHFICRAARK